MDTPITPTERRHLTALITRARMADSEAETYSRWLVRRYGLAADDTDDGLARAAALLRVAVDPEAGG